MTSAMSGTDEGGFIVCNVETYTTTTVSNGGLSLSVSDSEEDEEDFDDAMWIGAGKQWNSHIPPCVRRARDRARSIPPSIRSIFILSVHLTVDKLRGGCTNNDRC